MNDVPNSSNEAPPLVACTICGYKNPSKALLCINCGSQLANATARVAPKPLNTNPCPNCQHPNRPGMLICENCGTNLRTGERIGTAVQTASLRQEQLDTLYTNTNKTIDIPEPSQTRTNTFAVLSTEEVKALRSAGASLFENEMLLRIEVHGSPTPIIVKPKSLTVIGRRDPISGGAPDVDLTAYAGYRMGVSRTHAQMRLQEKILDLIDLGSSNGTFVNGKRLLAHQPHPLRDGDEIALGKMVMRLFFQASSRQTP